MYDDETTQPIPIIQTPVPSWHLLAELEFIEKAIISIRERYNATKAAYYAERDKLREARRQLDLEEERLDAAIRQWDAMFASREKANIAFMEAYRREVRRQEHPEPAYESDQERFERYSRELYGGS